MARMPAARWLGERSPSNAMSRYDVVCVHTIVGFAPAHAAHFSVHHDGTIDQSRDTRYQSGANLEGNHRVIAIENEDHGSAFPSWNTRDGHAVPALTAAQVEANAQILAWAHKTHGIPLQMCPNSRPTSRGLAYHRQGIDGNWSGYKYGGRVSGGEVWSSSRGKVCPGDRRIDQLPAILARAKQIVGGDSMQLTDKISPTSTAAKRFPKGYSLKVGHVLAHILGLAYQGVYGKIAPNGWMKARWPDMPDAGYSPRTYWRSGYGHARAAKEEAVANGKQIAKVAAEVAGLRNAVEQLAGNAGQPIDMAAVQSAALAGAQAAMAELSITVTVEPAEEPDGSEPDPADGTDA